MLNFQVIEYLMKQQKVRILLDERDNEKSTFGVEIRCKFFKPNPKDDSRSAYIVDFVYDTDDYNLQKNDDVSVKVEVIEGNPVSFKILGIKVY